MPPAFNDVNADMNLGETRSFLVTFPDMNYLTAQCAYTPYVRSNDINNNGSSITVSGYTYIIVISSAETQKALSTNVYVRETSSAESLTDPYFTVNLSLGSCSITTSTEIKDMIT